MNDSERWQIILDIVTVCKRMWQKGWVANHDGNATVRIGEELIATPTAVSKADIIPELILTLDMDGKKLAGPGKPFSEISLHLTAYRSRPDVMAVVHAHPPYATARGACGLPLEDIFIPEAIVSIGDNIPVISSEALASSILETNVVIIAGNGVLAVGMDVMQAYLRLELVEHLAYMDFIARQLGNPLALPAEDIAKLLEKRAAAGLDPKKTRDEGRGTLDVERGTCNVNPQPANHDQLRKIIAEEIKSVLG